MVDGELAVMMLVESSLVSVRGVAVRDPSVLVVCIVGGLKV